MATYYIDYVGGNDTNNGTSDSTPFQHCPGDPNATGNADITLANGDIIYFEKGITYEGAITTNQVNVTYTISDSWGTGSAVIDGGSNTHCLRVQHDNVEILGNSSREFRFTAATVVNAAIWSYNGSAIDGPRFAWLTVDNCGDVGSTEGIGIKIGGDAGAYTNYEIDNCILHTCYSAAIKISGSGTNNINIHNNEIYNSGQKAGELTQVNLSSNAGAGVQGVTFHDNILRNGAGSANGINCNNANNDIYRNQIYSNGGRGISLNPNYNTNYTGDILVYKNDIYDNGNQGIIISTASQTRFVKIYNNKFYNNTDYEINLSGATTYTEIYNNSFFSTAGNGIICQASTTNTSIRNNIFQLANGYTITDASGSITEDYNFCYRVSGANVIRWNSTDYSVIATYRTASSQGTNSTWADPDYINPPSNMELDAGSSAINDGIDLSVEGYTDDKNGISRPQGAAWDIGAYEYNTLGSVYIAFTV